MQKDKKFFDFINKIKDIANPYEKHIQEIKLNKLQQEKYNFEPSIYDAESNIKLFLSKLKDKIHKDKNLSQILVITHG